MARADRCAGRAAGEPAQQRSCTCRFIVSSTAARPVRRGPWPLNSGIVSRSQLDDDFRRQLATGQNAKLRLIVRLGILAVSVVVGVLNPATVAARSSSMSTLVVARYIGVVVKVRIVTPSMTSEKIVTTTVAVLVNGVEPVEKMGVRVSRKKPFRGCGRWLLPGDRGRGGTRRRDPFLCQFIGRVAISDEHI